VKRILLLTGALGSGLFFMEAAVSAEAGSPVLFEPQAIFGEIQAEPLPALPKVEPTQQLQYDMTNCNDNPMGSRSITEWNCDCTQTNIYVDTTGMGVVEEVLPVYFFFFNGQWLRFPWPQPLDLDSEGWWGIAGRFTTLKYVGDTFYAAGLEYQGELLYVYVDYPVTINCP